MRPAPRTNGPSPSRGLRSAALLALVLLAGCATRLTDGSTPAQDDGALALQGSPDGTAERRAPAPRAAPRPAGPAFEITWEALAREKYLAGLAVPAAIAQGGGPVSQALAARRSRQGLEAPQRITLINRSHPRASAMRRPRTQEDRAEAARTVLLSDEDMQRMIQGLERMEFFRYARPAGYGAAADADPNARGRITVVRGGAAHTLVSRRGQGQNPQTRAIPRIYSDAKRAITVLRNDKTTLTVTRFGLSGTAPTR